MNRPNRHRTARGEAPPVTYEELWFIASLIGAAAATLVLALRGCAGAIGSGGFADSSTNLGDLIVGFS